MAYSKSLETGLLLGPRPQALGRLRWPLVQGFEFGIW